MTLSAGRHVAGNGAPAATDFPGSSPPDGTIYVDKLNGHLYVAACGAWLLVDIASATTSVFTRVIAAAAATVDLNTNLGIIPWTGTVTSVKFIAATTLTGANTNSRTLSLVNLTGPVTPATLAFVSAVNATADTATALTLSSGANVAVASGDILQWQSAHVGGSGLADPGGTAVVTITRTP